MTGCKYVSDQKLVSQNLLLFLSKVEVKPNQVIGIMEFLVLGYKETDDLLLKNFLVGGRFEISKISPALIILIDGESDARSESKFLRAGGVSKSFSCMFGDSDWGSCSTEEIDSCAKANGELTS